MKFSNIIYNVSSQLIFRHDSVLSLNFNFFWDFFVFVTHLTTFSYVLISQSVLFLAGALLVTLDLHSSVKSFITFLGRPPIYKKGFPRSFRAQSRKCFEIVQKIY